MHAMRKPAAAGDHNAQQFHKTGSARTETSTSRRPPRNPTPLQFPRVNHHRLPSDASRPRIHPSTIPHHHSGPKFTTWIAWAIIPASSYAVPGQQTLLPAMKSYPTAKTLDMRTINPAAKYRI
ncbi:hypothetical protein M758_1G047800 [Ceratodon purpureus]|nr:hypothetical protein M758_1G047800 [Ceratodon purpureus]